MALMMKKMMGAMTSNMSAEKKMEMMEEMMPKMMAGMKPGDMASHMHRMMPKMMEHCLGPMNLEERKDMVSVCRDMVDEMEEKYVKSEASKEMAGTRI